MNNRFQYLPDDLPSAPPSTSHLRANLPTSDVDFLTLAESVRDAWNDDADIHLLWTTRTDLNDHVNDYRSHLTERRVTGSARPAQTQVLFLLDKEIDFGVKTVRAYIREKWGASDVANYARYGIVRENSGYRLPKDRDERRENLDLMLGAIAADGFGSRSYGTAYWANIKTQYLNALSVANATDGQVSDKVASKNEAKKAVKKVLVSLHLALRANYPDTWRQVVRTWGWQKEDY